MGMTQLLHPIVITPQFFMTREEFNAVKAMPWPVPADEGVLGIDWTPPDTDDNGQPRVVTAKQPALPPGTTVASVGGLRPKPI
jgi:hypothetical protein